MRRHSFRSPLVLSRIFLGTLFTALAAFLFQTGIPDISWPNTADFKTNIGVNIGSKTADNGQVYKVTPLAGHWLRTGEDQYHPASLALEQNVQPSWNRTEPVVTLDEAKSFLNRRTDTLNIMYIWSDDRELKVISVTSFNRKTKQAAIIVMPLHTVVKSPALSPLNREYPTLQDTYREQGRNGVKDFLEEKLDVPIVNYVHVNQSALRKLSEIIGPLKVSGDRLTMLEAFEQTAAGVRTDDREVVRAVSAQIMHPRMVLEVPDLLRIFTQDITTNLNAQQMINIFNLSRQMDLENMRKTALPGYEHAISANTKYLFVSDQVWKNIIYEITR